VIQPSWLLSSSPEGRCGSWGENRSPRQLGRSVDLSMAHCNILDVASFRGGIQFFTNAPVRSSLWLIMTHYVIFQPYAWHILKYLDIFSDVCLTFAAHQRLSVTWIHMELLRRCGRNSFSSATCRSWVSPWYSLQSHFFTAFWDRTVLLSSDIKPIFDVKERWFCVSALTSGRRYGIRQISCSNLVDRMTRMVEEWSWVKESGMLRHVHERGCTTHGWWFIYPMRSRIDDTTVNCFVALGVLSQFPSLNATQRIAFWVKCLFWLPQHTHRVIGLERSLVPSHCPELEQLSFLRTFAQLAYWLAESNVLRVWQSWAVFELPVDRCLIAMLWDCWIFWRRMLWEPTPLDIWPHTFFFYGHPFDAIKPGPIPRVSKP
jgi:hypothetical protein